MIGELGSRYNPAAIETIYDTIGNAGSSYAAFLASRMAPERAELNALREAIYKLGEELRQPIWVAEISCQELRGQPPEAVQIACLRLVRRIPQFICIVDGSYGTPWNLAQLCVLELEMLSAALTEKPFHFYLLAPYEADARTESLLRALRVAKPEVSNTTPKSPDEILSDLRVQLPRRGFGSEARRQASAGTPPNLDVQFLDGNFTPLQPDPSRPEMIRELLARADAETDEATRLVATWMAIRHLCAAPYSDPMFADFLPLWDAALSRWASAAAWYGLHGPHYLGRLAAVNTAIWIRERMPRRGEQAGVSIQASYGARASEFYSMAKATRAGSLRRFLLRRALVDVNRALEAGGADPSGLLAIRGSVRQALGKRCAGLRDYQTVLRMRVARNEDAGRVGEAQAELGMGYLRVGRVWKGGRYLLRGVVNLEQTQRYEFSIRALRKLAVYYVVTLRRRRAIEVLRRARDLAQAHEVKGQLQQIVPMLETLEGATCCRLASGVLASLRRSAFRWRR